MQYKISEDCDNIQSVFRKMFIENEVYYMLSSKVDDRIMAYVRKMYTTTLAEEIEANLTSTDFLKGVLGNAMMFEVVDFFMGKPADVKAKGKWVHSSILFPMLAMTGHSNFYWVVKKIEAILDHASELKEENQLFAEKIVELNEKLSSIKKNSEQHNQQLSLLPSTVKNFKEDVSSMKEHFSQPEIVYSDKVTVTLNPNPKHSFGGFTTAQLNTIMRDAGVKFKEKGKWKGEYRYSECLKEIARVLGWVKQHDKYHYTRFNFKTYTYTYTPSRKPKDGNAGGLPIQHFGFTKEGAIKLFELLSQENNYFETIEFENNLF